MPVRLCSWRENDNFTMYSQVPRRMHSYLAQKQQGQYRLFYHFLVILVSRFTFSSDAVSLFLLSTSAALLRLPKGSGCIKLAHINEIDHINLFYQDMLFSDNEINVVTRNWLLFQCLVNTGLQVPLIWFLIVAYIKKNSIYFHLQCRRFLPLTQIQIICFNRYAYVLYCISITLKILYYSTQNSYMIACVCILQHKITHDISNHIDYDIY